jgi:hypothetical protein
MQDAQYLESMSLSVTVGRLLRARALRSTQRQQRSCS